MKLLVLSLTIAAVKASGGRFACNNTQVPPDPAGDVSKLHPGHVQIVAAVGDSITAAFAARASLDEARDISWCIGKGTSSALTLPWMIGQYNPEVTGMSTKKRLPKNIFHLPDGDYSAKTDHLNVAESEGAVHRGSMDQQWHYLTTQSAKYANFDTAWKVVTVWMTANDVCGAGNECKNPVAPAKLASWSDKHDELLTNISAWKNVYVNLVSMFDMSNIARIQRGNLGCSIEHKLILKECGCIDRGDSKQLKQLDENVHTFNTALHTLAAKWHKQLQASGRKDMAVTLQPFQEGLGAKFTLKDLNSLDCFHPSVIGHEDLAIGLWNSMLCGADGRKERCGEVFSEHMAVTCPTVDSRFYTGPDVVPGPPNNETLITTARAPEEGADTSGLPEALDYRAFGDGNVNLVTKNLDQHQPNRYCGSCWAHAAMSALADRVKIARRGAWPDIVPSIQVVLNCAGAGSCKVNDTDPVWRANLTVAAVNSYKYVHEHGIPTDTCLQYQARDDLPCTPKNICQNCGAGPPPGIPGSCSAVPKADYPTLFVDTWGSVSGEADIMAQVAAHGPVACAMDASPLDGYKGGIVHDTTGAHRIGHIVSIAGWGVDTTTSPPTKYWHVRNSWGDWWGEGGWFRIVRGENNCAIESHCAWATPKLPLDRRFF